jgi:hypothetical protein
MKMPNARSIAPFVFSLLLAVQCPAPAASESVRTFVERTGIRLSVASDGSFEVTTRAPAWTFAGNVGSPLSDIALRRGRDRAGGYRQVEFKFKPSAAAMRLGAIRVYDHRPVVVFKLTFLTAGKTSESFPSISRYPRDLHHLAYTSTFGGFSFDQFGTDGPWIFFDDKSNAFILSPASHYMNAALSTGPHGELLGGIAADSEDIPPGFAMMSALVIVPGINRAFDVWGRFLTDLAGKKRPANDADVSLKYLGYWTDHGARYYYRFEDALGYAGTLLEVRRQFRTMNIRLGYVQLDSWFYPKGRDGTWNSGDPLGGGTYRYEASRELFPDGLSAFRRRLGLPLIVHNRWIDAHSPYRKTHAISGNVSTDPALWTAWMRYLRKSGVRVYEQDWLSGPAAPARDLASGELFMDTMARAAAKEGIALQYCMPLPRHFLQGTRYSNLSTIRVSGDRFGKDQWASFLFNGRLASALGEWPWTDVFMSSETSNLLLATLSASIVGVGDALGQFDRANLDRVVRADGLIVKPDDAIAPLDSSYVEQAKDRGSPIVAAARTRHADSITSYVFAFAQAAEPRPASVSPAALGYGGPVYAYNAFDGHGRYLQPSGTLEFLAPANGAYWIVVPVGPSGVGFLGDAGRFVSNGSNRVDRMRDTGELTARVVFSAGESRLRLHGFSRARPDVRAMGASVQELDYDSRTGLFHFDLLAKPGTSPEITISLTSSPDARGSPPR